MVALGVYAAATGSLKLEEAVGAMREKFVGKEAFFPINNRQMTNLMRCHHFLCPPVGHLKASPALSGGARLF